MNGVFPAAVREDLLDKMVADYELTREQAELILSEFEFRAQRESSPNPVEVSPRVFARQRTADV